MTMNRFRQCASMLACAGVLLLADSALAEYHHVGTVSRGQLKAACGAAGGNYGESGGTYTCSTNCSAKGHCSVDCNKDGCSGYTPDKSRGPVTVGGVLSGSAGTASAAGGTATKKPPLHNVNQPIVVQHPGGARSGGSKH